MLLEYCLSDFEMVPVAPVISGISFAFNSTCNEFLLWCLCILKSSRLLSVLITCLSPGIATSIDMHVPCVLLRIMMSGLLLGTVLSVRNC